MAAALRITELLAELMVRIHLPPLKSQRTFGSSKDGARCSIARRIRWGSERTACLTKVAMSLHTVPPKEAVDGD
jgi:hypothetical protein